MTISLLEASYISQIKEQHHESYRQFILELVEDVKAGAESPYLSEDFQQELKKIVLSDEIRPFSSFNHYWSFLIEDIIEHIGFLEELDEDPEVESELIDFLTESEFAGAFLELNQELSVYDSALKILELKEIRAISFFHLQIAKKPWRPNGPVAYHAFPEIGDSEDHLYIRGVHYPLHQQISDFPLIPVVSFDSHHKSLEIEDQEDLIETNSEDRELSFKFKGIEISLYPSSQEGFKDYDSQKESILKALDIIEKSSPELLNLFKNFNHSIIPLNDEGLVSFSMESLPGFSSVNLYHRDFVDLIDDLIHETGHHFLNAHLSFDHLINEDYDQIYYSPWRKTMRPIRGLYHAFFTFYWAFELFYSLNKNATSLLSDEQNKKVKKRLCEEHLYLKYCIEGLNLALEREHITTSGMDLVSSMIKKLQDVDQEIDQLWSDVGLNLREELVKNLK